MTEELKTVKLFVGQWIPCSDRLPEEDGDYIVTHDDGRVRVVTYEGGWNCWRSMDGTIQRYHELTDIFAWMPVPKPYKEDEDDEQ